MYEYEMSEKLFLDIWEKYECPEEVSDPLKFYNILNDIIVKSKHWIVLDHYSHINFDEVKKVEYDETTGIFKLFWLDNNSFREKRLRHEIDVRNRMGDRLIYGRGSGRDNTIRLKVD